MMIGGTYANKIVIIGAHEMHGPMLLSGNYYIHDIVYNVCNASGMRIIPSVCIPVVYSAVHSLFQDKVRSLA